MHQPPRQAPCFLAGDFDMAWIIFLTISLFSLPAWAATRWANPTNQGLGNCSSSANACILQTAFDQMQGGDTILLKAGTHNSRGLGYQDNVFHMHSSANGTAS